MKRYDLEQGGGYNAGLEEDPTGVWCEWEDVEPLLARLAKLEAVRVAAENAVIYRCEHNTGLLAIAIASCDEKEDTP